MTPRWGAPGGTLVMSAEDMLRDPEAWREKRRLAIGASDLAAMFNVAGAFLTPYQLWREKVEGSTADRVDSMAMELGRETEDAIARVWARMMARQEQDTTPVEIRRAGMYVSKTAPHAAGTPDRFTSDGGGAEVKDVTPFKRPEWSGPVLHQLPDGVTVIGGKCPEHYRLQCEQLIAVTGRSHWWLVARIDKEIQYRRIEITPERATFLLESIEKFWQAHIVANDPPAHGQPPVEPEVIPGKVVDAFDPDQLRADLARWKELLPFAKAAKDELDAIKARVGDELGEAEQVRLDGIPVAGWQHKKGSLTFNKSEFGKDHPELLAKYTRRGEPTKYPVLITPEGDQS